MKFAVIRLVQISAQRKFRLVFAVFALRGRLTAKGLGDFRSVCLVLQWRYFAHRRDRRTKLPKSGTTDTGDEICNHSPRRCDSLTNSTNQTTTSS